VKDHCFCWPPPTRNTPLSTLWNIRSKFDRSCYPTRLLPDDRLCVVSSITGLTTRHGTFGCVQHSNRNRRGSASVMFCPGENFEDRCADEMGVTSCLIQQDRKQMSGCWRDTSQAPQLAHIPRQDLQSRSKTCLSASPQFNAISNPIVDIQCGYSYGHVGYTVD